MTTFPLELEIQMTAEAAADYLGVDSDEFAIAQEQANSTDMVGIGSWDELPEGYEPCNEALFKDWMEYHTQQFEAVVGQF